MVASINTLLAWVMLAVPQTERGHILSIVVYTSKHINTSTHIAFKIVVIRFILARYA